MPDQRARMAREYHRWAADNEAQAALCREKRDEMILALRADDPRYWSYSRLAKEVGCSEQLIAYIVTGKRAARGTSGGVPPRRDAGAGG